MIPFYSVELSLMELCARRESGKDSKTFFHFLTDICREINRPIIIADWIKVLIVKVLELHTAGPYFGLNDICSSVPPGYDMLGQTSSQLRRLCLHDTVRRMRRVYRTRTQVELSCDFLQQVKFHDLSVSVHDCSLSGCQICQFDL